MAIQQRAYNLRAVTANAAGSNTIQVILNRRRHRWRNWHAWVLHEVFVLPTDAALAELTISGRYRWIVYAAMRDADQWGGSWTALYTDPNLSPVVTVGSTPQNPNQFAGLLQYAQQRTERVTSAVGESFASARHAWSSLPRLVAADQVNFQYGTDANTAMQGDLIVRFENITLPGWRAWVEAVEATMGRTRGEQVTGGGNP